jgi:hypothetical protein
MNRMEDGTEGTIALVGTLRLIFFNVVGAGGESIIFPGMVDMEGEGC